MNGSAYGATGIAPEETTGGRGGRSGPTIQVDPPQPEVVSFLLNAVQAGNGVAEFAVWASNAPKFSDLAEAAENEEVISVLEDVSEFAETASLEDLLGVGLEAEGIEFIGTEPLLNEGDKGQFSDLDAEIKERYNDDDIYSYGDEENGLKKYIVKPDWLDIVREDRIDDTVINHSNIVLNGHYYPEIREFVNSDEATRLKASVGRNHNHQDNDGNVDHFSKRRHVAFSFESSGSTADRIVSAAGPTNGVGHLDEEDVERYQNGDIDLDDVADLIEENR